MNRHATIDHVAKPTNPSPDAYRLLVTCRVDPGPAPNGREPSDAVARPDAAAPAGRGSIYLPRWRFGSRRRRRTPPAA